jgi:hypothetical protein
MIRALLKSSRFETLKRFLKSFSLEGSCCAVPWDVAGAAIDGPPPTHLMLDTMELRAHVTSHVVRALERATGCRRALIVIPIGC